MPSTYPFGSSKPSESKLNQLFGSGNNTNNSSYIPMHSMVSAASQQPQQELTSPNDLSIGSPRNGKGSPRFADVNGPTVLYPGSQSSHATLMRNVNHQKNNPNQATKELSSSPNIHQKAQPNQSQRLSPNVGDISTTVSNSGITSPTTFYPTGNSEKEPLPQVSTFGKSRPKQPPTFNSQSQHPKLLQSNSNTIGSSNNSSNTPNESSSKNSVTLDLKLFDHDFVREKSSAGRISAKSSRGDLHLT